MAIITRNGKGTPLTHEEMDNNLLVVEANETKLATIEEGAQVNVPETVTSLVLNGDILTFTDEDGTNTQIDLSGYKDEDYRAISSGTLNGVSGVVTFTRDDNSTFDLDLSDLLPQTIDTSAFVLKTGSTMSGTLNIQNLEPTLYLKSTDNTVYPEAKILHSDAGFYIQTDNVSGVLKNQYRIKPQSSGAEHIWYSDGVTKMTLNDNGELDLNGNLDLSGDVKMDAGATVDGRDVSVDGTKLDGIEAGANNYVLPETVMQEGENVSLLNNDAGYLTSHITSVDGLSGGEITSNVNVLGALQTREIFMSKSGFPTAIINSIDTTDPVLELRANNNSSTAWTIRNDYSVSNSFDVRFNNNSMITLTHDGEIIMKQAGKGIQMKSPNGTTYTLTVSDAGELVIS